MVSRKNPGRLLTIDYRGTARGIAALLLAAMLGWVDAAAQTPACTTATSACEDWIATGPGPQKLRVYRSHALDTASPAIRRALVIVHGGDRDAGRSFRTGMAVTFLAGGLDTTLVVAPHFASSQGPECHDMVAATEIAWPCGGWRWGSVATTSDAITSFAALDDTLKRVARRDIFPNLRFIVVAGFSAGGQYVVRYAMANRVHDTLGVPVSYVVGSPSSYAYPDAARPNPDHDNRIEPYPDAQNCTTFHRWPYGMQERQGYAAAIPDAQLRSQLAARPITYLVGALDTTPDGGLDMSCPALAQGNGRVERAQAFVRLVAEKYKATPRLTLVRGCGHEERCVFTSDAALPILLPSIERTMQ
jgi:acetyl esterase/lipase